MVLEPDRSEVLLKLVLLLGLHVMREEALIVDGFLGLLKSLFDGRFHPVTIVGSGAHGDVFQLLLDILPNLPILEVGIELNHLHPLLLVGSKIMEVEANAIE